MEIGGGDLISNPGTLFTPWLALVEPFWYTGYEKVWQNIFWWSASPQRLGKAKSSAGMVEFTRETSILNFHFTKSLHFYDFGPNGNYRESLKVLCVLSQMPAGFFPQNTSTPWIFVQGI